MSAEIGRLALYAGSFDPFTNGHLYILKEACNIFDKVYLCIADNSAKNRKISPIRTQLAIQRVLSDEGILNCEVIISKDKMIADVCKELDVKYLIRGLRNTSDYLYEENIAKINKELNSDLRTIYLRGENECISSSMVRELLLYHKDISKYVPDQIRYELEDVLLSSFG